MFGPKIRNVFRSRWQAVFWSASVLLTAYCSVPSKDDDADHADVAKIAASLGGQKPPPAHKNPWAKDAPAN